LPLTPYDPLRILRYVDEVPAMRDARIDLVRPRMLLLYPSMTCNQNCGYCYYTEMHRPKEFMPSEKIADIFDDVIQMGVEGVELCGGGEPMLHPEMHIWLEYGLKLGLKFGILTHGAVTRNDVFDMMGREFSYVRFSLDYANPHRYAETRGVDFRDYERVLQNVQRTIKARDKANSNCRVSIKATIHEQTAADCIALYETGKGLGVDSVQFKRADEVGGGLDDDPDRRGEIENILMMMRQGIQDDQPDVVFNFGRMKLQHRCWLHPVHAFIETDGDVHLCCYYTGRQDTHKIGNVHEKPLSEIWGSPEHVEAMKATDIGECNKYACRFIGYMDTLTRAVDNDEAQLQFM